MKYYTIFNNRVLRSIWIRSQWRHLLAVLFPSKDIHEQNHRLRHVGYRVQSSTTTSGVNNALHIRIKSKFHGRKPLHGNMVLIKVKEDTTPQFNNHGICEFSITYHKKLSRNEYLILITPMDNRLTLEKGIPVNTFVYLSLNQNCYNK